MHNALDLSSTLPIFCTKPLQLYQSEYTPPTMPTISHHSSIPILDADHLSSGKEQSMTAHTKYQISENGMEMTSIRDQNS